MYPFSIGGRGRGRGEILYINHNHFLLSQLRPLPLPHTLEEPYIKDLLAQQKQQSNSSPPLPNIPALLSTSYTYSKAHSLGLSKVYFLYRKANGKQRNKEGCMLGRQRLMKEMVMGVRRKLRLRGCLCRYRYKYRTRSKDLCSRLRNRMITIIQFRGAIREELTTGKILTGTHTPSSSSSSSSSRPFPTIPIHPSLISLLDINDDPESEPKSESAFKNLDTC